MHGISIAGIRALNRSSFIKRVSLRAALICLCPVLLSACLTNPNQPPQLLRGDTLEYPPNARAAGIEGTVEVRYDVRADGSVHNVRIVSANPAETFDTAALNAVRRWRFRPGRVRGEPSEYKNLVSTVRFTFGETQYPSR